MVDRISEKYLKKWIVAHPKIVPIFAWGHWGKPRETSG